MTNSDAGVTHYKLACAVIEHHLIIIIMLFLYVTLQGVKYIV